MGDPQKRVPLFSETPMWFFSCFDFSLLWFVQFSGAEWSVLRALERNPQVTLLVVSGLGYLVY